MPVRFLVVTALLLPSGVRAGDADRAGVAFFEAKIRPVLVQHCYQCHSAEAQKTKKLRGGLLLDSRAGLLKGGDSGPALVPGKPAEGTLLKALRHEGEVKMPPRGKLAGPVLAEFEQWLKIGAPDPRDGAIAAVKPVDIEEGKKFWSFQPLRKSAPPEVKDGAWPRNDIDRFLLAALEARGLKPAPPADRHTFLRRLTFDLTGLPPTAEEIASFVADATPQAAEKAVERLLASPHYGERWGRHWLDVVRYADTAGETADYPVPQAHKYRDHVIAAFNADKPYNEFVRDQIAGDILASSGPKDRQRERIIATGFLAISRRFGFDPQNYHHLTIQDTIDTAGQAFLGLSLGCARCHDHKFDPVTARDYYALYGIFAGTRYAFPGSEEKKRPSDLVQLGQPGDIAYAVLEGKAQNVRIHKRGEPRDLGPEVPRRFLEVFGGEAVPANDPGSGRLQLARWLTETTSPLLARVMVNRIWQHHFGAGIVATENDFGSRGKPPTHPELLDWLACRFAEEGWSIKAMHRLIMSSAAYQQSSLGDPRTVEADPDNHLLGRFTRRRLDAESIRDAMLSLSGKLDRVPGGPHPFPPVETWGFTQHAPFSAVYQTNKRSVYLMTQRLKRHPFLALFDGPDTNASTPHRSPTTVPTQALFLMNSPFVHEQADSFAGRLLESRTESARIELAHLLALGRPPTAAEVVDAEQFLARYRTLLPNAERMAWAGLARTLLIRNEFLFVE